MNQLARPVTPARARPSVARPGSRKSRAAAGGERSEFTLDTGKGVRRLAAANGRRRVERLLLSVKVFPVYVDMVDGVPATDPHNPWILTVPASALATLPAQLQEALTRYAKGEISSPNAQEPGASDGAGGGQ